MLYAHLTKTIGTFSLDTRITSDKGSTVALFGPSGCGKTTIINMLAGNLKPCSGRIRLNNQWIFHSELNIDLPPEKRRFGYVFQEGRLFPHLSVKANLNYGRKLLSPQLRRIDFDQVVEMLGIEHLLNRRPSKLSGGEKQRVAIGRSLLMSPLLLLMDEPLASLDNQCKSEILPFIATITRELSIPVVYVSHAMEEIKYLTDNIIHIARNKERSESSMETNLLGFNCGNRLCEAGTMLH